MKTHFANVDNEALATTHAATVSSFQIRSVRWQSEEDVDSEPSRLAKRHANPVDEWEDVDWGHMDRMHARMMARSHTQIYQKTNDVFAGS